MDELRSSHMEREQNPRGLIDEKTGDPVIERWTFPESTTPEGLVKTQVTGDWLGADVRYDAFVRPGNDWNGWAVPLFTKDTAVIVANDQNLLHRQDPEGFTTRMEWDGDVLQIHDDETVTRVAPSWDGFYPIGAMEWTWQECPQARCVLLEVTVAELRLLALGTETLHENNPGDDDARNLDQKVMALLEGLPQ